MANFKINIDSIVPTYNRVTTAIQKEECENLIEDYPVQLESYSDVIPFSIIQKDSYTGAAWKTLRITGANPSYTGFILHYNGVPITVPIDIDITGLAADAAIPLLTVNVDGTSSISDTKTISVVFDILDVNNIRGISTNSSMQLQGLQCAITGPQDPEMILSGLGSACTGGTNQLFSILGEPNQSVRYQIATIDNDNNGYTGVLGSLSPSQNYLPASAVGTGATVDGYLTLNGIGILDMTYEICANLPKRSDCNAIHVVFSLYKKDGITVNTSEQFTIYALSGLCI